MLLHRKHIGTSIKNERRVMNGKQHKNSRTLDLYVRLCEGKSINKKEEARRFGVDERSIQRDIDDIRAFLNDRCAMGSGDARSIEYDRKRKGFIMIGTEGSMMTNSEILAVSKILLESRAFTKRELEIILDKLVEGCVMSIRASYKFCFKCKKWYS